MIRVAVAIALILLAAFVVLASVADAELWRWLLSFWKVAVIVIAVIGIGGHVIEGILDRADRENRFEGNFNESEFYVSSRGYAGPKDSRLVDNQPHQDLIESLRDTWQNTEQ